MSPARGQAHVGGYRRAWDELPHFARALCRDLPALDWLAEDPTPQQQHDLITVCCRCPEVAGCAAYALANPTLPGVWGGLTLEQRRRLAASRRPA